MAFFRDGEPLEPPPVNGLAVSLTNPAYEGRTCGEVAVFGETDSQGHFKLRTFRCEGWHEAGKDGSANGTSASDGRARRTTGGRDGRRLERFAEMCQWLTSRGRSHPGLLPLANLRFDVSRLLPAVSSESDVATTPRARKRKLLAQPSHEFRPRNPGDVVGGRFVA
jgi:hypothetical protein